MAWELVEVPQEPKWQQDGSGVYTVINRVACKDVHKGRSGVRIAVRVDLMEVEGDEPIQSWIGAPDAVRKTVMRFFDEHYHQYPGIGKSMVLGYNVSREHAAYIGAEIERAGIERNYVQK